VTIANDTEAVEEAIEGAERCGILVDARDEMPKGDGVWPTHATEDVLGACIHQNGSQNTTDPTKTAKYHTSPSNHITPGRSMPTICYDFAVPDLNGPPWLVANPLDRKYEQGNKSHPGDENRHLLSILVMGSFTGPGYSGYSEGPTMRQIRNLESLLNWCQHTFHFGDNGIFGHFDFGKSFCPGIALTNWIEMHREEAQHLTDAKAWQRALLIWDPSCLPRYGADGDWGEESKYALSCFQRGKRIKPTAFQDVFTELMLLREARRLIGTEYEGDAPHDH
jgi:hypothetical protein